jgi:hypothetical protein
LSAEYGFPSWRRAQNAVTVNPERSSSQRSGIMDERTESERALNAFNGVKVFSATMAKARDALGEQVTAWLSSAPGREVVDTVITQSSDEAFHCIAITIFYRDPLAAAG